MPLATWVIDAPSLRMNVGAMAVMSLVGEIVMLILADAASVSTFTIVSLVLSNTSRLSRSNVTATMSASALSGSSWMQETIVTAPSIRQSNVLCLIQF